MPVQPREPPPRISFAQVRCPKGYPQWVTTSNDDPIGVAHLICPECGLRNLSPSQPMPLAKHKPGSATARFCDEPDPWTGVVLAPYTR